MTARLLVAAVALVACATRAVAFDLLPLKRALFLLAGALLLATPPMQAALVRTVDGGARAWLLAAGGFTAAAGVELGLRFDGGQSAIVARATLELLLFALLVVLAREVAWERGSFLCAAICGLGGALAAVAVAQVAGFDLVYGEGSLRAPVSTLGNTNAAGAFLAPCLAVAAARAAAPRRPLALLSCVLLAAALLLARSRGAWIAAVAGAALAAWLAARRGLSWRRPLAALCAGLLLGLVLDRAAPAESELGRKPLGLGRERASNVVRLEVAAATLELARAHPWLGVGPGRFRDEFPLVRREREARIGTREGAASEVDHPHCEPLRLLAEGGALTLLLAIVAVLACARALLRARDAARGDDGSVRAALAGGGLAWLVAGAFWSTLGDPACALLGALLAGAALAAEPEVASVKPWQRPLALGATAALGVAALLFAVPTLRAECIDWRATRDERLDRADLDRLAQAARIDASNLERQYSIGMNLLQAARQAGDGAGELLRAAGDCFARALAIVPRHAGSLEAVAEVRLRLGEEAAARRALAALHAIEPWRGDPGAALSALHAGLGHELEAARLRLEREGELAIEPLFERAVELRAAGRSRPAAQVLDLIAPLAPDHGDLQRELALAWRDLGDEPGYARCFRRSQLAYAAAALADGRNDDARTNLRVARRYAPEAPGATALEELLEAVADLQRGRPEDARARLAPLDALQAAAALGEASPLMRRLIVLLAAAAELAAEADRLGLPR